MKLLLILVLTPVVLIGLLQIFAVVQMQRKKGSAAPKVAGQLGQAIASSKRSLIYFYSPSCGPCRRMAPTIDALQEQDDRVYKVDVSQTPEVAMQFGVMGTPAVVLVSNGVIDDIRMGFQPKDALVQLLA